MSKTNKYTNDFYSRILGILKSARNEVVHTVNTTMVETYFEIGKLIVEEEQTEKNVLNMIVLNWQQIKRVLDLEKLLLVIY